MQKFMVGFVVFLVYCIPARWHYVCQIRNLCEDKQPEKIAAAAINKAAEIPNRTKDLSLKAEDVTILAKYDQFGFLPNSSELQLTDNNIEYLEGVATYLKANPDAKLKVTGFYLPNEQLDTNSIYENLGLARAAAIREYLQEEYNIESRSLQANYQVSNDNTQYIDRPLVFEIITEKPSGSPEDEKEKLADASYTFTRMTFSDINFKSNSVDFNPSKNFVSYADSVKRFLDLNPGKSVTIVGHTDNVGTDDYNYGLGLTRANNVIIFLRDSIKIDMKLMSVKSEGEQQPIAPNNSESNKRKNRRVEIIIN